MAQRNKMAAQPPSPTSKPFSLLLGLPPELVDKVFDYAYAERTPARPLCKALLPFHRQHSWRKRVVRSCQSLKALVLALKKETGLARRVQVLTLDLHCSQDWIMFDSEVKKLFPLLTQVNELRIERGDGLTLLPYLLEQGFPQRLAELHVLTVKWPQQYSSWFGKMSPSFPDFPHLTSLNLSGADSSFELDSTCFLILRSAPQLTHLSLVGLHWMATPSPAALLAQLVHPERLESLALHAGASYTPWHNLPSQFSLLAALRTLEFSGAYKAFPLYVLPSLADLPLQHLILGNSVHVDMTSLFSLLDPAGRSTTLSRLTLNMVEAKAGETPAQSGFDPAKHEKSWNVAPRPPFGVNPHRAELEQLIETAAGQNIVVDGTAVEALKVEDEYLKQRAELEAHLAEKAECEAVKGAVSSVAGKAGAEC
ncbi:hypothetical protein JCM10213_000362 [Rhodosporidiobolus nylandii]